jgi:hypothetical protein
MKGGFQELIDDAAITDPKKVRRVLLCTGKIYYELLDKQEKDGVKDIAIVRLRADISAACHTAIGPDDQISEGRIGLGYRRSQRTMVHGHSC